MVTINDINEVLDQDITIARDIDSKRGIDNKLTYNVITSVFTITKSGSVFTTTSKLTAVRNYNRQV